MRILYPKRTRFAKPIRVALSGSRERVSAASAVTVRLKPGGFEDELELTIDKMDPIGFQANWEYRDPSWFPARIRAAAYSLFLEREYGAFLVSYRDGLLSIKRLRVR